MSIEIRNNVARVAKVEIARTDKFGAYLALQLHIELTAVQLKQFVEGRYAVADQAVYGSLYAEWDQKFQEAERRWQDRTNAIMHEYNLACEDADERGKPRPSPPKLGTFVGPAEPERIKASRPCKSLREWYVHVHAELVDEDHQLQRVELGASTKGTPRLTTEGALALLELRLDERYCERSADKDEVWEWLQLAGQEFRVFGAQLTIDDVIEDAVEEAVDDAVQPHLDLDRMNAIAASVEADLQAQGHDVAVEAVPVDESKTIAQWSQELGEPFTVEEYIDALKRTGFTKTIRAVTRLTKAQHLQVLVGLSLRVAPAIDEVRKPRWQWADEIGCDEATYRAAISAVLPDADEALGMGRPLTQQEHDRVCAQLAWMGVPNRSEEPQPAA